VREAIQREISRGGQVFYVYNRVQALESGAGGIYEKARRVQELVPTARVGYIGLQRDERTAIASRYYSKLPQGLTDSYVLMIDPMLATGGSASAAIGLLRGAGARRVRIVCIVAAPEGVAAVERDHPDVVIYTPVVDSHLNAQKYIVPGLGDFGDRLYGTL